MWLFESPQNYSQMLKKVAWSTFFIVLIALFILAQCVDSFAEFMKRISFNMEYEIDGIKLYTAYFYIPFIFAILENIFKLHDRISDIFRIRYRFDKFVIINRFLHRCKMEQNINKINKRNREEIMYKVFYEYASSTKPVIDPHLICMALGAWRWYWIINATVAITGLIGIIMLIMNFSFHKLIVILGIILVLYIFSFMIKHFQCKSYAIKEVDTILNDEERLNAICRYLTNALLDK
jgi:hypothetical protein